MSRLTRSECAHAAGCVAVCATLALLVVLFGIIAEVPL